MKKMAQSTNGNRLRQLVSLLFFSINENS